MSVAKDKKKENDVRPTGLGPGERLQEARIQQGLSLDDVANRMHLSISILAAIEENDFEEITAPIFVKGYLRAYARIVSLDEDDMISQYSVYYSGEDPPISSTSNMVPELSVADARIKWTTYLVIIVLLVLLAAWWWNKQNAADDTISLDTPAADEQVVEAGDIETVQVIEASSEQAGDTQNSTAEADETMQQEAVTAAEPTVEKTAEVETVMESEELSESAQRVVEEEAVIEEASSQNVAVVVETETADEASPVSVTATSVQSAPVGSDRLDIIVHADTWADIKDSTNYQLIYDLLRADRLVELTGTAPFTVFLGNGHGVEIVFNGESVDFASRVRDDNTARLEIGG